MNVAYKGSRPATAAFSLVEITISLGILAFALTGIISLTLVALKTSNSSQTQVEVANLMTTIIESRRAAPLAPQSSQADFVLPPIDQPTRSAQSGQIVTDHLFLDQTGRQVTESDNPRFRMSYRISPAEQNIVNVYVALSRPWNETDLSKTSELYEVSTYFLLP